MSATQNCGLSIEMLHVAAHMLVTLKPPAMLTMAQQAPPSQSPPMQTRFSIGPASPPPEDDVDAASSPVVLASSVVAGLPEDELLQPAPAARARPRREEIKRMLLVCIVKKPFVSRDSTSRRVA